MLKSLLSLIVIAALAAGPVPAQETSLPPAIDTAAAEAADTAKKAKKAGPKKKPAVPTVAEATPAVPGKAKKPKPASTKEKPASGESQAEADRPTDSSEKKPARRPSDSAPKSGAAAAEQTLRTQAVQEAKKLTPTQTSKLLDLLNSGSEDALQSLPGVGRARAKAITNARPFAGVPDFATVDGIGEDSFNEIVAWAKAGMNPGETAAPAKPPATTAAAKKAATTTKP